MVNRTWSIRVAGRDLVPTSSRRARPRSALSSSSSSRRRSATKRSELGVQRPLSRFSDARAFVMVVSLRIIRLLDSPFKSWRRPSSSSHLTPMKSSPRSAISRPSLYRRRRTGTVKSIFSSTSSHARISPRSPERAFLVLGNRSRRIRAATL